MPPIPESSPLWQRFDISKIVFNSLKYFSSDPILFIKWYDIYVLSNASDKQDVLYHNTRIIGSVSRFIVGSTGYVIYIRNHGTLYNYARSCILFR